MDPGEPSESTDPDKDAVLRLHRAVIADNQTLVGELLEQNENIAAATDAGGRTALHVAAEHDQLAVLRFLLGHGADTEAADASGRTVLHHAVDRDNVALATLLLEHGANAEAATPDGEKPLWMAANQGRYLVAERLLESKAGVESFNAKSGTTALSEAVKGGHAGLVKLLLNNGADIDARQHGGQAAGGGGASGTQRWGAGGRTHGTVRPAGHARPLPSAPTGPPAGMRHPSHRPGGGMPLPPPIISHRPAGVMPPPPPRVLHRPAGGMPVPPPPPPPGWSPGRPAPRADQPEADRELPLHQAVMSGNIEMVKLLLQHGADADMRGKDGRSAQQVADEQDMGELAALLRSRLLLEGPEIKQGKGKQPQGAPPLVRRSFPAPRHNPAKMAACRCFEATMVEFYTEGREQRYQKSVPVYELLYGKGPTAVLDAERPRSVAGKPANFTWYHLPANNMEWVEALVDRVSAPQNADPKAEERFREKLGILRRRAQQAGTTARPSFMRPHSKEIKGDTQGEVDAASAARDSSVIAFIPYLHFENFIWHDSLRHVIDAPGSVAPDRTSFHSKPSGAGAIPANLAPPDSAAPTTHQGDHQYPQENTQGQGPDQAQAQMPNERQTPQTASPQRRNKPVQSTGWQGRDATHPYMHLIGGYSQPDRPENIPGWQPRRSLDGYFYTHLGEVGGRDGDQVVLRYTTNNYLPFRIFMVDQLWVWILGKETIITCSALNWESWTAGTRGQAREGGNIYSLVRDDPMDLHQKIIRHLKRGDRDPVTSVHDLACLVADTCTGLFDQDEIPDELRFFDFFERDIARLSDTAMRRLNYFRASLEPTRHTGMWESTDTRTELSLLVEVQDICDELEIIRKVLKDQGDSMSEMKHILTTKGRKEWTGGRATVSHMQWVDRMQQMATKTKESLYHLVNLKLKQASFSEAVDMRKQAQDTARQTALAAEHSQVMADQLKAMKDQAVETGRQGRTLLVFTVVTIIFLPSSFIVAVFSVGLDSFPVDDRERLPLGYFLKYLFAISCAVTIPLVFIAFNLTRIADWWVRTKESLGRLWREDPGILWTGAIGPAIALVVEGAVVGALWAAPLAASIKAAVTICVSLVVAMAVAVLGLYTVSLLAQRRGRRQPESDGYTNSNASTSG